MTGQRQTSDTVTVRERIAPVSIDPPVGGQRGRGT
jgi:hypothetical protein